MIPDIRIQKDDKSHYEEQDSYSLFVGESYIETFYVNNPYSIETRVNDAFANFLKEWFRTEW